MSKIRRNTIVGSLLLSAFAATMSAAPALASPAPARAAEAVSPVQAVVGAIESGDLALSVLDSDRPDILRAAVRQVDAATYFVSVPLQGSGAETEVVEALVTARGEILDHVENEIVQVSPTTANSTVWQNGVPVANRVLAAGSAAEAAFRACLERNGVRGDIAEKYLTKCNFGTMISPAKALGCMAGFGISRDVINNCANEAAPLDYA
ncbi:hypothetical protein ACFVMC_20770 [Nocardia sp. NPDC127579]|uniref:hypothetical protein n=1 Tax=Nocardia sp. NPDC127579 TaxID=3345402 RepID=UPI0036293CF2